MTLREYLNSFVNKSIRIRLFVDGIETRTENITEDMAVKQVQKASTIYSFGTLHVHVLLKNRV